ncbi:MAG: hypothetical protein QXS68_06785, partial [Candidatus Methanomethylicaceae archaeon]
EVSERSFFLMNGSRYLYSIVDDQFFHFRPRPAAAKLFQYKRRKIVVPYTTSVSYVPSSFPGVLIEVRNNEMYGYFAYLKLHKRYSGGTSVLLYYSPLGKIEKIQPVTDKYGWTLKVKLYLSNGKRISLIRGGTPMKYPKIHKDIPPTEELIDNTKAIRKLLERIHHYFLVPKAKGNQNIQRVYRTILNSANKLAKTGTTSLPFKVPLWLTLLGLPEDIKPYLDRPLEEIEAIFFINAVIAARTAYRLSKERKPLFQEVSYFKVPVPDDYKSIKPEYLLHLLEEPRCPFLDKLLDNIPQLTRALGTKWSNLSTSPYTKEVYEKLSRYQGEIRLVSRFLWKLVSKLSMTAFLFSSPIDDIISALVSFKTVKIMSADVYIPYDKEEALGIVLWIRRSSKYFHISALDCAETAKEAVYLRHRPRLITGYVKYPHPQDYLLYLRLHRTQDDAINVFYSASFIDRRPKAISSYLRRYERHRRYKVRRTKGTYKLAASDVINTEFQDYIFRCYPLNMIYEHEKNITSAFPIRTEFALPERLLLNNGHHTFEIALCTLQTVSNILDAFLNMSEPYSILAPAAKQRSVVRTMFCLGHLDFLHLEGKSETDLKAARLRASTLEYFLGLVSIDNHYGYWNSRQLGYFLPSNWLF